MNTLGRIPLVVWIVAACTCLLTAPAGAIDIAWTNAAGGAWGEPGNWSPAQVPGPEDRALVTLPGTYTVTIVFADAASVATLIVGGGQAGLQTVLVDDNASIATGDSVHVGASGSLVLRLDTSLAAGGAMVNEGRLASDMASVETSLGLENRGTLELTNTTVYGAVTNHDTLRTIGHVGFDQLTNEPGGSWEIHGAPVDLPGASMSDLVNRGRIAVDPALTFSVGDVFSNEAFAVLALGTNAVAHLVQAVNAGVIRCATGARFDGTSFHQSPDGELEVHYGTPTPAFFFLGETAELDGTLTPVFDPGFTPPAGDLPLILAQNVSGRFAVVNASRTNGLDVQPVYPGFVYLRVFRPGLSVLPPTGGAGPLTVSISGSSFKTVTGVRLRRAGEIDIVAKSYARDPTTGVVTAQLELTGGAQGAWDVVVQGPDGGEETGPGAFAIVGPAAVPVSVEVYGRERIRRGNNSEWSVAVTNPGNIDVVGALEIVVPGHVRWELVTQRAGAQQAPDRVSGKYDDPTTLIVPGLTIPPGVNFIAARVRLEVPLDTAESGATLRARWFQP